MSHLSDYKIQEYISGDCFFLWALYRKFHIRHCPSCQKRAEQFMLARKEQESFGEALKEYREFSFQAEATMKVPKV